LSLISGDSSMPIGQHAVSNSLSIQDITFRLQRLESTKYEKKGTA